MSSDTRTNRGVVYRGKGVVQGESIQVGRDVEFIQVGDIVSVPFNIGFFFSFSFFVFISSFHKKNKKKPVEDAACANRERRAFASTSILPGPALLMDS